MRTHVATKSIPDLFEEVANEVPDGVEVSTLTAYQMIRYAAAERAMDIVEKYPDTFTEVFLRDCAMTFEEDDEHYYFFLLTPIAKSIGAKMKKTMVEHEGNLGWKVDRLKAEEA